MGEADHWRRNGWRVGMEGGGRHLIMVEASIDTGKIANRIPCRLNKAVTTLLEQNSNARLPQTRIQRDLVTSHRRKLRER